MQETLLLSITKITSENVRVVKIMEEIIGFQSTAAENALTVYETVRRVLDYLLTNKMNRLLFCWVHISLRCSRNYQFGWS